MSRMSRRRMFDAPAAICRISKSSTNNLVWFARKRYHRRGRIVEFCHAWIKSKLGLRKFHVRGLAKAQMEMLWACLTTTCSIGFV